MSSVPMNDTSNDTSRAPTDRKSGNSDQGRRCWECVRRRLVCDLKRPSCAKCSRSGVICPGYGENKPLTWLTPGKVRSKVPVRKRKVSPLSRDGTQLANQHTGNSTSDSVSELGVSLPQHFKVQDLITDVVQAARYCKLQWYSDPRELFLVRPDQEPRSMPLRFCFSGHSQ